MRALTAVAFFGRRNEVKVAAKAGVRVQNYYKFVLSAGAKAKSVTSNLPILSVLAPVFFI
jgi:hypothetical protein